LPAKVSLFGAGLLVPLSGLSIFGWGPIPNYGITGAGYAPSCRGGLISKLLIETEAKLGEKLDGLIEIFHR